MTIPGGGTISFSVADPLPIDLPLPLVLLRLGYRRPSQVPERTSRLIDEAMARARDLLAPRAICALVYVESAGPAAMLLGGSVRVESRSVHRRLAGCPRAVLFAATVGPAVEAWIRELTAADDLTRALLADACASAAAIALGNAVEKLAGRLLEDEGLKPQKRYAPGYGDWDLSGQGPLHALLGSDRIGIRVTEEFLMIPAKSISGLIGGRPAGAG